MKTCHWKLEEPDWNAYATECGEMFCIEMGTPQENKMRFCPFCGGRLTPHAADRASHVENGGAERIELPLGSAPREEPHGG